jgi:hypothetical protein
MRTEDFTRDRALGNRRLRQYATRLVLERIAKADF